MTQIIEEPSVPFVSPIKGGFEPGTMARIQGKVPNEADRFNINLHCGSPPSDIALHISVRLLQNYIARNSCEDEDWGDEESSGDLPIGLGQHFEILILCHPAGYKIAVNGNHFCEFPHRISFKKITHIEIDGNVSIGLIAFESAIPAAPPPPPPPQYMAEGPDMPPGYAPPPPPGNFGYGPSMQQGPFGGGPGHYPHQRGQGEESGFESLLGTAGTAIASAMVSGLAENLLGGLTGQSQRNSSSSQPQTHNQGPYNQGPYDQGSHNKDPHNQGSYDQGERNPGAQNQGGYRQGTGSIIGDLLSSLASPHPQTHNQSPHNQGSLSQGAYDQGERNQGPHNQGGYRQGTGSIIGDLLGSLASPQPQTHNQGLYHQGEYEKGPYNQGERNQGTQNQGERNQGAQNQGGYNQGAQNQGGYNQGTGSIIGDLLGSLAGGGQPQRNTSSPQPQTYNQGGYNQGSGSIVGDLLGSLTGGGQSHHHPTQPQNPMYNQGGQHQQGSGSIVGDILGSFASEMLRPSRRN